MLVFFTKFPFLLLNIKANEIPDAVSTYAHPCVGCIIDYINENCISVVQCQESYFCRITAFIQKNIYIPI